MLLLLFFISLVFGNVVVKRIFTENKTGERKKNSFETKGKKPFPLELYKSGMDGWNMQYVMMVLYYNEKLL